MQRNYFIAVVVFFFMTGTVSAQKTKATPKQVMVTKADMVTFKKQETSYGQLQEDLKKLEQQKTTLLELMKQYDEKQKQVVVKMQQLETTYDSMTFRSIGGKPSLGKALGSQKPMGNATRQMQETQMSFNLQYLQLQSQMQHENRSYTAISNIMKTKHDTIKNSISNVR